jgi:hypothetical protein
MFSVTFLMECRLDVIYPDQHLDKAALVEQIVSTVLANNELLDIMHSDPTELASCVRNVMAHPLVTTLLPLSSSSNQTEVIALTSGFQAGNISSTFITSQETYFTVLAATSIDEKIHVGMSKKYCAFDDLTAALRACGATLQQLQPQGALAVEVLKGSNMLSQKSAALLDFKPIANMLPAIATVIKDVSGSESLQLALKSQAFKGGEAISGSFKPVLMAIEAWKLATDPSRSYTDVASVAGGAAADNLLAAIL